MSWERRAAELVRDRIGLPVDCRKVQDGWEFQPSDLVAADAFAVDLRLYLTSAEATLRVGGFAGRMLRQLAAASPQALLSFSAYVASIRRTFPRSKIKVNGTDVSGITSENWPRTITSFEVSILQTGIEFDASKPEDTLGIVGRLVLPVFGMMVALLETDEPELLKEGGRFEQFVTRYERRAVNREACIEFHGMRCVACGFDFAETYGPTGDDFIEVHHLNPVGAIGEEHLIDPVRDLRPLCSNCHSIAHRRSPPHSIGEIQAMLEERRPRG